jgi:hypothetical protein
LSKIWFGGDVLSLKNVEVKGLKEKKISFAQKSTLCVLRTFHSAVTGNFKNEERKREY